MTNPQPDALIEEFIEPFCDCAATTEGPFAGMHSTGCASLPRNWAIDELRRVVPVVVSVLQEVDEVIHKETYDDIVSVRFDLPDDADLNVTLKMGLIRRLRRATLGVGQKMHTRFNNDAYEAPRDASKKLRIRGIGRVLEEPRAVILMLNERPTDDEMRALHDRLRLEALK